MAEYIKKKDAIAVAESMIYWDSETRDDVLEQFDTMPAEDVVPVVRCKDCIHRHNCIHHLPEEGGIFGDDDFCSFGEKNG